MERIKKLNEKNWEDKLMGKIIVLNAVQKKEGYLYYLDKKGNLCEAKMKQGGTKKKIEQKTKKEV